MNTLKKVVLYKQGLGLFLRELTVSGDENVSLAIHTSDLSKVISTLTILDSGNGRVESISYDNDEMLKDQLSVYDIEETDPGNMEYLHTLLKGSLVELTIGGEKCTGYLLCGDSSPQPGRPRKMGTLYLEEGTIKVFPLEDITEIRPLEAGMSGKIRACLSVSKKNPRTLTIRTKGEGTRRLGISYIVPNPPWEITYRLLLSGSPGRGKGILEAWAIVHNAGCEPWEALDLVLKSSYPANSQRKDSFSEEHEFYEYHISNPLSIPAYGSALVLAVKETLDCEEVLIFNPLDEKPYTYSGVILKNSTKETFDQGTLTLFSNGCFCGNSQLPTLEPGEGKLVRYAENNHCKATCSSMISRENVKQVQIRNGEFMVVSESVVIDSYEVQNETGRKREVIIEHPRAPGQHLLKPRNPYETTESFRRFRITVPHEIPILFEIESMRESQTVYLLNDLTKEEIADFVSNQWLDGDTAKTLNSLVQSGKEWEENRERLRKDEEEWMRLNREKSEITRQISDMEEAGLPSATIIKEKERISQLDEKMAVMEKKIRETGKEQEEKGKGIDSNLRNIRFERTIPPPREEISE